MTSIEFLVTFLISDSRVQGINDLSKPTSVKGVRSFFGMAYYFCDFIKGLSGHRIPFTAIKKMRSASEPFRMTREGRAAFVHI